MAIATWAIQELPPGAFAVKSVHKNQVQSVYNTTVLVNDNALFLAVGANEVWYIEFTLKGTATSAACIEFNIIGPTYSSGFWWRAGDVSTLAITAGVTPFALGTTAYGLGAAAVREYLLYAYVWVGEAAGNIQLQFAQHVAGASYAYIWDGSFLRGFRVL